MKNEIIDDRNEIYRVYSSSCTICKHFKYSEFNCIAFPKGIPDEILTGKNDHSKPLPNQGNDIIYEPFNSKAMSRDKKSDKKKGGKSGDKR